MLEVLSVALLLLQTLHGGLAVLQDALAAALLIGEMGVGGLAATFGLAGGDGWREGRWGGGGGGGGGWGWCGDGGKLSLDGGADGYGCGDGIGGSGGGGG